MFNVPSRRLYLGRLPTTFTRGDVEKHLSSYGTIVECKVMDGFGFVEFLNLEDAEDVVETFSRQSFLGEHIVCEFAKPLRKEGPSTPSQLSPPGHGSHANAPPAGKNRYCVWVFNLSEWTRWQDLKDLGRTGGAAVAFSDIDSVDPTLGFIEYFSSEDAKRAAKLLDKTELRGNIVRVKTQQQVNRDRKARRSRSRSPIRRREFHNVEESNSDYLGRNREGSPRNRHDGARGKRGTKYSCTREDVRYSVWENGYH